MIPLLNRKLDLLSRSNFFLIKEVKSIFCVSKILIMFTFGAAMVRVALNLDVYKTFVLFVS